MFWNFLGTGKNYEISDVLLEEWEEEKTWGMEHVSSRVDVGCLKREK